MPALPDVVIQRFRNGKALYLGLNGWTEHRVNALSFDFAAQAQDWLKSAPAADRDGATIETVPAPLENPGQGEHKAEYDPYAGAP